MRGATSVTLNNSVPAIVSGSLGVLLGYRMLDGSTKNAVYRWDN